MASKREVVEIPGLSHNAPIPMGAKIGNMVFSSAISGRDPETGKLPEDPDRHRKCSFATSGRLWKMPEGHRIISRI